MNETSFATYTLLSPPPPPSPFPLPFNIGRCKFHSLWAEKVTADKRSRISFKLVKAARLQASHKNSHRWVVFATVPLAKVNQTDGRLKLRWPLALLDGGKGLSDPSVISHIWLVDFGTTEILSRSHAVPAPALNWLSVFYANLSLFVDINVIKSEFALIREPTPKTPFFTPTADTTPLVRWVETHSLIPLMITYVNRAVTSRLYPRPLKWKAQLPTELKQQLPMAPVFFTSFPVFLRWYSGWLLLILRHFLHIR